MMSAFDRLTERELEVATLPAADMPTTRIALRLDIAYATVGSHQTSVRRKLGIETSSELTLLAIREGLISMHDEVP